MKKSFLFVPNCLYAHGSHVPQLQTGCVPLLPAQIKGIETERSLLLAEYDEAVYDVGGSQQDLQDGNSSRTEFAIVRIRKSVFERQVSH